MANEKVIHLNDPATFEEQTKEVTPWSIFGQAGADPVWHSPQPSTLWQTNTTDS